MGVDTSMTTTMNATTDDGADADYFDLVTAETATDEVGMELDAVETEQVLSSTNSPTESPGVSCPISM